jgi:hypothetical protein
VLQNPAGANLLFEKSNERWLSGIWIYFLVEAGRASVTGNLSGKALVSGAFTGTMTNNRLANAGLNFMEDL